MNSTPTNENLTLRKKRRPARSCDQCRRRKIKCDRSTPCRQCIKANIDNCVYVRDSRITLTEAPFEAQETQFFVFDQRQSVKTQHISTKSITAGFEAPDFNDVNFFQTPPQNDQDYEQAQIGFDFSEMDTMELDTGFPVTTFTGLGFPATPITPSFSDLSTVGHGKVTTLFKEKFYGQSHWKNYAHPTSQILAAIENHETAEAHTGIPTLASCKVIGRKIEEQDSSAIQDLGISNDSLKNLIPSKEISSQLIQAYLRTFQTVFGSLHVPSFLNQYDAFWIDAGTVTEDFLITFLLILCIGSTFCTASTSIPRVTVVKWINTVSTRLNSSKSKRAANIDALRIHCLFFLACQVRSIKCNDAGLLPGVLLRRAMQLGLHMDPGNRESADISQLEAEGRRKLWATVLELETQYSLDSGTLPAIAVGHYDCSIPMNVDDEDLEPGKTAVSKPMMQLTQSSIQILLMKTMSVRLRIVHLINNLAENRSYETALKLSTELSSALKNCKHVLQAYMMSSRPPTPFQTKFFEVLIYRFLIALHQPFATPADPAYYFSRKVSLETALFLFSDSVYGGDDDFDRLRIMGVGPFRNVYREAVLCLCAELVRRVGCDKPLLADPSSAVVLEEVRRAIQKYGELGKARVRFGDTSVKCFVLVSCFVVQADAMERGSKVLSSIATALRKVLDICYSLLSAQIQGVEDGQDAVLRLTDDGYEELDWSQRPGLGIVRDMEEDLLHGADSVDEMPFF